jgi:hypothetical protein
MLQKSIERENQVIRDNKLLRLVLYDLHSALKTMLEGQARQYHQIMDLDVSFFFFLKKKKGFLFQPHVALLGTDTYLMFSG